MKCLTCQKTIQFSDWLRCLQCKSTHHHLCQNITSADFREHGRDLKLTWKCLGCTNVTRRRRTDETPIRVANQAGSGEKESHDLPEISPPCSPSRVDNSSPDRYNLKMGYEDFSKLLDSRLLSFETSITNKIKIEFNLAVEALKAEFTQTTDFLAAEQRDLKCDVENANAHIKSLEFENVRLSNELKEIVLRLRDMEKVSRSCNVEIQAVPETKQEDLCNILKQLCVTIANPIMEKDISSIRRVARRDSSSLRPRNVLVTFSSQRVRDDLIAAFKSYNKNHRPNQLNSNDLNIAGPKSNIYVVEHLSPELKKLHAATRKAASAGSYKYVWVKNGRIYVRKADDSSHIQIKTEDCLKKIL